jgi:hypothetical protein
MPNPYANNLKFILLNIVEFIIRPYPAISFNIVINFALIWSRTSRNFGSATESDKSVNGAGSSKPTCSLLTAPGNTGQVSLALSQTVITKFKSSRSINSSTDLERLPEISIPISAMTSIARRLTWLGFVPAENACQLPFRL